MNNYSDYQMRAVDALFLLPSDVLGTLYTNARRKADWCRTNGYEVSAVLWDGFCDKVLWEAEIRGEWVLEKVHETAKLLGTSGRILND